MLDNELDIISGDQHNTRDVNKFNDFVLKSELNDVWRLFNAEQKEYTWSRKNPFTARRLDYILSTDTILNNIHDCSIHSVAQSDHRLVNTLYDMAPHTGNLTKVCCMTKHLSNNLIHFVKNLKKEKKKKKHCYR